jgi:hypothetical protein
VAYEAELGFLAPSLAIKLRVGIVPSEGNTTWRTSPLSDLLNYCEGVRIAVEVMHF